MKQMLLVLTTILTLLLSVNSASAEQASREKVAWQEINNGVLVIDVRSATEFATGHIENALNIPHDIAVKQFTALGINKDRRVVLYCRSGNRSGKAIAALIKAGYTNLHNGGGYKGLMANK